MPPVQYLVFIKGSLLICLGNPPATLFADAVVVKPLLKLNVMVFMAFTPRPLLSGVLSRLRIAVFLLCVVSSRLQCKGAEKTLGEMCLTLRVNVKPLVFLLTTTIRGSRLTISWVVRIGPCRRSMFVIVLVPRAPLLTI